MDEQPPPRWPERLHHEVPVWVKAGSLFHIRLRVDPANTVSLTDPLLARNLLSAVQNYHQRHEWHCLLVLLMPDHLHALLAFPADKSMTSVVGSWKRYAARFLGVKWQTNFFDHRLRQDRSVAETWGYIMRNPVVKGLCAKEADWPWVWRSPD